MLKNAPISTSSSSSTTNQLALGVALLLELAIFAVLSPAFLTATNLLEILRFSVELGLLAVVLTPILVSGGIDLSVGSAVGLVAVVFGVAARGYSQSIFTSAVIALLVAALCGVINASLIAWLRLPPLIVTLATYSLYRGIAEGVTQGSASYTGFPSGFLQLGQGYWHNIPIQLFVFLPIVAFYTVLLHRSVVGRALYTMGFNAEGARYAGLPVVRYRALVYLLSGIVAGIAAIIYVAHLGLAKSDMGTGFELQAITAVVLGGTSVLGGRGTITGSLLGLLFLTVLANGMHMLGIPSEITGVITGLLLLAVVTVDLMRTRLSISLSRRRSIVAVLGLVGLLAVAGAWWLHGDHRTQGQRMVIAVMPKAKGDPYFVSARAGAEEAAKELHVDLLWDGPTSLDASQQNELVENWITRGVNAIAVAVENKGSISTVLRKARQHNIPVLTWDADAQPDARNYFLNQATPQGIAEALVAEAARMMPGGGDFAIITGALSAENQNDWIAHIKQEVAARHPNLHLITVLPSDDDRDKAFAQTQNILKVYPNVKLVIAISAPAVPGAAEAVAQSGRPIFVTGLSLPSICRPYIHNGTVQSIVLWNTRDLGYLTVYAGWLVANNKIAPGQTSVSAGRLGPLKIEGSQIVLGKPLLINQQNIDQLNF